MWRVEESWCKNLIYVWTRSYYLLKIKLAQTSCFYPLIIFVIQYLLVFLTVHNGEAFEVGSVSLFFLLNCHHARNCYNFFLSLFFELLNFNFKQFCLAFDVLVWLFKPNHYSFVSIFYHMFGSLVIKLPHYFSPFFSVLQNELSHFEILSFKPLSA
jgi:hypothetical protein